MNQKAQRPEQTTRCCQSRLLAGAPESTFYDALLVGSPRLGPHARAGNGLHDGIRRNLSRTRQDRHTAVKDVEREAVFTANDGTDFTLKRRYLLGAIHPVDFER